MWKNSAEIIGVNSKKVHLCCFNFFVFVFFLTVQSVSTWFWFGGEWVTFKDILSSGWGGAVSFRLPGNNFECYRYEHRLAVRLEVREIWSSSLKKPVGWPSVNCLSTKGHFYWMCITKTEVMPVAEEKDIMIRSIWKFLVKWSRLKAWTAGKKWVTKSQSVVLSATGNFGSIEKFTSIEVQLLLV